MHDPLIGRSPFPVTFSKKESYRFLLPSAAQLAGPPAQGKDPWPLPVGTSSLSEGILGGPHGPPQRPQAIYLENRRRRSKWIGDDGHFYNMILNIDRTDWRLWSLLHYDLKHRKCDVSNHSVKLTNVADLFSKVAKDIVKETNVADPSGLATMVTFTI